MHHILPFTFTFLTTILLTQKVSACMHYRATFPYSTSLPFEATLTDDGIVVCWISMTYDQHNKQQTAFSNRRPVKSEVREMRGSLTGSSSPTSLDNQKTSGGDGANEGVLDGSPRSLNKTVQDGGADELEHGVGIWLPWEFQCMEGYQSHAGIGLRAVWYKAHGQEFEFVPEVEEDVFGEKWVYKIDLWCS